MNQPFELEFKTEKGMTLDEAVRLFPNLLKKGGSYLPVAKNIFAQTANLNPQTIYPIGLKTGDPKKITGMLNFVNKYLADLKSDWRLKQSPDGKAFALYNFEVLGITRKKYTYKTKPVTPKTLEVLRCLEDVTLKTFNISSAQFRNYSRSGRDYAPVRCAYAIVALDYLEIKVVAIATHLKLDMSWVYLCRKSVSTPKYAPVFKSLLAAAKNNKELTSIK